MNYGTKTLAYVSFERFTLEEMILKKKKNKKSQSRLE